MEQQIALNKRKTALLFVMLAVVILIFAGILLLLFEWLISAITMGILIIYILYMYFNSIKRLIKLNRAQLVDRSVNRQLYELVDNLSISVGIKTPKVYIIDDPALNAFAAGKNPENSIIGVTRGLLETLDKKELEGVLAHEMGHIINRDVRLGTIAFAVSLGFLFLFDISLHLNFFSSRRNNSGALVIIAVLSILGFVFATLIRLAISRRREYLADTTGAEITRYPDGLKSALQKIAHYGSTMQRANSASAHLFISNPLKRGFFSRIFNTHPPIEDRINKLENLNKQGY